MLKFEPKLFLINMCFYLFFMLLLLGVLALAKHLNASLIVKVWFFFCLVGSFLESLEKGRKK
jgi:hypothetical protein